MPSKPTALFVQQPEWLAKIYGSDQINMIAELVDLVGPPQTPDSIGDHPELLAETQLLFTGWGAPSLDEKFLDAAQQLQVVFFAGGSAGGLLSPRIWERQIQITSAYVANGVPVAEYCLGAILLSLKHSFRFAHQVRQGRTYPDKWPVPGGYKRTVGLISMGAIARLLVKLLRPFDLHICVWDPFLSAADCAAMDVERVDLKTLFERSDVVSLHTPWLPETEGLIKGEHLASMKSGATFINTARGMVVREPEMLKVAAQRPDLQFILDVVIQEPPDSQSPLYTLPNIFLTPHIAGSMDGECQRMGQYMIQELERYLAGQPLQWVITPDLAACSTHRPFEIKKVSVIRSLEMNPIPSSVVTAPKRTFSGSAAVER